MQCTAKTARGARCRRPAAPDALLCVIHLGLSNVGRPSELNPAVTEKIVQILRTGGYAETAARAAGVTKRTLDRWLVRGKSEDPAEAPYREFREAVAQARAEGEARHVALISSAGAKSWQASAWLLERQYPERWGNRDRSKPTAEQTDPFSEVDEIAQRRAGAPRKP